jgi:hypothetical protein
VTLFGRGVTVPVTLRVDAGTMPRKDPDARREYNREYQRRWYQQNRELHIRRVYVSTAKRRALLLQRINELKDRPCADCGVRYPPFVMDFDHVAGQKIDDICGMRRRMMKWHKILAEMEKCEVVCANCHRMRTRARADGGTVQPTDVAPWLAPGYSIVPVY